MSASTQETAGSTTESGPALLDVAFYTVADETVFLGAVALLNSLRLVGHAEPVFVLDCGLSVEQRSLLQGVAEIVDDPPAINPALLKAWAPLARPARVMVVLDADVIAVRSLDELIADARRGQLVLFRDPDSGPDRGDFGRHRPEWGDLLGLGTLPRRPYVNSGHFLVPAMLRLVLDAHQQAVFQLGLAEKLPRRGAPRTQSADDPFWLTDQDLLNAVLAANVATNQVHLLEARFASFPPFTGLRCDPRTLACEYSDGETPFLLHHVGPKPWLHVTPYSVYAQLLRRLLMATDVAVQVPAHLVPLRLRTGALAWVDRSRTHLQAVVHSHTRGRLGIRRRVEALRVRRRSGESV